MEIKKRYNLDEIIKAFDECISNPVYLIRGIIFKHKEVHLPSLKSNFIARLKEFRGG